MIALLDTHILLWWLEDRDHLSPREREVIDAAHADEPLYLADITLWEIATLHELGRIKLNLPLRDWLERATSPPLVKRVSVTPAIAAEVASLPSSFHRDPADRIIVASARVLGATLVTRDRKILDAKIVPTLEKPQEHA